MPKETEAERDVVTVTMPRRVAIIAANKLREERVELARISNGWAKQKQWYDPDSSPWRYADEQAEGFADLAAACWDNAKAISEALHG